MTTDFTFPSSVQGYLTDNIILDVDEDGSPDLEQVEGGDGLIVTNLFGHTTNIQKYLDYCQDRKIPCIFDNACTSFTFYNGKNAVNYGDGCIISLHHTKPIGFGEGGLIILKKKYEKHVRKLINFGFEIKQGQVTWDKWGNNAKMSDISASFIYDYVKTNFDHIVKTNTSLYSTFLQMMDQIPNVKLLGNSSDGIPFVNCLPLICNRVITNDDLYILSLHGITARKYYTPLTWLPKSKELYDHILCLPLNIDMNDDHIKKYVEVLKEIL